MEDGGWMEDELIMQACASLTYEPSAHGRSLLPGMSYFRATVSAQACPSPTSSAT